MCGGWMAPVFFSVAYGLLLVCIEEFLGRAALASAVLGGALPLLTLLVSHEEWLLWALGLAPMSTDEHGSKHEAGGKLSSDTGDLDWANLLVDELWPHIAKYTEDLLHSFEPTLQEKLRVPIRFKSCSLGNQPVQFGPIKAHVISGHVAGKYMERAGLELQVGVDYNSDVDVVLSTLGASIGLANLCLKGTLSILLRPFLDTVPFIGGVEVVFTNPPQVNIDFTGLGNVADLPGIHGKVRRVINDIIAKMLVVPHRIAVPIVSSKAVEKARLKNPQPEGVLRITVVRAENLLASDTYIFSAGSSDPYVQIQVGGETWQTPVVKQCLNPTWTKDNQHDFVVYSLDQWVQVDVWDWDLLSAADTLGSVNRCPVEELIACAGKGPVPFDLEMRCDDPSAQPLPPGSRLFLKVQWLKLCAELQGPVIEKGDEFILTFKITECLGLRQTQELHPPYTIRTRIDGEPDKRAKNTARGWAKPAKPLSLQDMQDIRDLAEQGFQAPAIAKSLKLDVDCIVDYLLNVRSKEQGRASSSSSKASSRHRTPQEERRDRSFIQKRESKRIQEEMACNPQFEEVLTLPMASRSKVLIVELVDNPAQRGRKEDGVIGRIEIQLGQRQVVEGPFSFEGPKLQGCQNPRLCGTISLWRLEHAESHQTTRWRGVAKVFATRALPRLPRQVSQRSVLQSPVQTTPHRRTKAATVSEACFPFLQKFLR